MVPGAPRDVWWTEGPLQPVADGYDGSAATGSLPGTRACHQLSQTTLATRWTAARKFRAVFS